MCRVRLDSHREWLAHLVQPFLRSDVVGAGGPNVVPGDDPWIAQAVYVTAALIWLIPDRRIESVLPRSSA